MCFCKSIKTLTTLLVNQTKMNQKLSRNFIYEETDVPAFLRINESESWFRVIFWYIVFICFATICVISVSTQYMEFMDNPMQTDVAIIRGTELKVPNMSICLTGWPSLPNNYVWSPGN